MDANSVISDVLDQLSMKKSVERDLLKQAFYELLVNPNVIARDVQLGALFSGLMVKKPTADEIISLIKVVLELNPFPINEIRKHGEKIICIAGSGKKGFKTINISTPATIVAASAGANIVKPGSHCTSSVTGSADLLASLGIKIGSVNHSIEMFQKTGIGFFSIEGMIEKFDRVYGGKMIVLNPLSFALPAMICPIEYSTLIYGLSHPDLQKMTSESPRFESWDERRRYSVIPLWDCLEQQFFIFNCFSMTIKLIIWNKNIEERKQLYL